MSLIFLLFVLNSSVLKTPIAQASTLEKVKAAVLHEVLTGVQNWAFSHLISAFSPLVFGWILVLCTWTEARGSLAKTAAHIVSWRLGGPLTPNSVYSAKGLTWISSSQCQPLCFTPYKARLSQRGEEDCIFVWKLAAAVPDKQSYCQRPPPGAKGMWKILAAMTVAMIEAVCYLLISGYFPNSIGWVWLLPLLLPAPSREDTAGHRIFLALGMPVGPQQKPLSATSLSFLHFSPFPLSLSSLSLFSSAP